jgi:hypothetical protein
MYIHFIGVLIGAFIVFCAIKDFDFLYRSNHRKGDGRQFRRFTSFLVGVGIIIYSLNLYFTY